MSGQIFGWINLSKSSPTCWNACCKNDLSLLPIKMTSLCRNCYINLSCICLSFISISHNVQCIWLPIKGAYSEGGLSSNLPFCHILRTIHYTFFLIITDNFYSDSVNQKSLSSHEFTYNSARHGLSALNRP